MRNLNQLDLQSQAQAELAEQLPRIVQQLKIAIREYLLASNPVEKEEALALFVTARTILIVQHNFTIEDICRLVDEAA